MSVKLRMKKLNDGSSSYFLEYYHGYSKTNKGNKNKRTYKFLKLYTKINDEKHNNKVLKEAQKLQAIENGKFLENKISYVASIDSKQHIVEVFQKYIDKKTSKSSVNVFRSSFKYLKSFINENQNRNRIKDIDKNLCDDFYLYLLNLKDQNILNVSTVNSYFKKFSQFLQWLYENDKLTKNPAKTIKYKKIPLSLKVGLNDEELKLLLSTHSKTIYQKAFLFACLTGLRFVDIKSLKYSNIYFDEESNSYSINIVQSKTVVRLSVQLIDDALYLLDLDNDFLGKGILVFPSLTYSNYNNNKLREWLKINGINKNISFHTGRYTMIKRLVSNKTNVYDIQNILGHQSILTTNRYIKNLVVQHNFALLQLPKLTA